MYIFQGKSDNMRGLSQYAPVPNDHTVADDGMQEKRYIDTSLLSDDLQQALADYHGDEDGRISHEDLILAGKLLKNHKVQTAFLHKMFLAFLGVFIAGLMSFFGIAYAAADLNKDTTLVGPGVMTSRSSGLPISIASTDFGVSRHSRASAPIMVDSSGMPIAVEKASYYVPLTSFAPLAHLSSDALEEIETLRVNATGTEYSFKIVGHEIHGSDDPEDRFVCFHTASRQVVIITSEGKVGLFTEAAWAEAASKLATSSGRRLGILEDIGNGIKGGFQWLVDGIVGIGNFIIGGIKSACNWVADELKKIR